MPRSAFLLFGFLTSMSGLAQNKVTVQSGTVVTFHNTVDAAVAAAQAGDVIQVPGGGMGG